MSMFDDLIEINDEGEILYNQWIEWDHFMIPNMPESLRNIMRNILVKIDDLKVVN